MTRKVVIVMATYNGAAYVEEQVRSLQAQDHGDWTLLVRDDGSTDGTPDLVEAQARRDPRIVLLPGDRRLGAIGNFGELLPSRLPDEAHSSCSSRRTISWPSSPPSSRRPGARRPLPRGLRAALQGATPGRSPAPGADYPSLASYLSGATEAHHRRCVTTSPRAPVGAAAGRFKETPA